MRISMLVENTATLTGGRGILAEHGLSYWLEAGESRVLFDTGASGLVLENNAKVMGIDLSSADAIVLSHGHIDHVGGLETALRLIPEAPLFMHPSAVRAKYSGQPGKMRRSDTQFFTEEKFRDGQRRVVASSGPVEVAKGVWMTGEIPRESGFENTGGPFFVDIERTTPDTMPDDQALFVPGEKGTVVLLGCAHAGIVNTLRHVKRLTRNAPIRLVVGGTHLESASPLRMEKTFAALDELGIHEIHPCHCTGMIQSVKLCEHVGGESSPAFAGRRIEITD
ncbi:MAG TPA: MBL fold metallo-hydrolase [Opitutales bacterium]|nr:MBL fold metallo-hydrolase [Opitutales bacterium]